MRGKVCQKASSSSQIGNKLNDAEMGESIFCQNFARLTKKRLKSGTNAKQVDDCFN